MTERKPLTSEEISAIVDGFEPIDVQQAEITARLTPSERIFECWKRLKKFGPIFVIN